MRTSTKTIAATITVVGLSTLAAHSAEKPLGVDAESIVIGGVPFSTTKKPVSFDELVALPTMRPGDDVLRDRLAAGIIKWETVKDHRGEKVVVWNECGKRIPQESVKENALEWANHLIRAANTSADHYGWRINLWGVMGTIANESNFDRCAIGRHTREWAYEEKLLKAKRFTWISHDKKAILRLVKHPKWQRTWKWVDAGPLQVLWKRIYRGPLEDMLTLQPGLDIGIQEMQRRSTHFQAYIHPKSRKKLLRLFRRSWRLWPGKPLESPRSATYDEKVTKYARRMGALRSEI